MKYFVIFLVLIGFAGTAFATHDPDQTYIHSIILPFDMKEKTFEEFMEWCTPYYEERCTELYEKNHVSNVLSPLKQFNAGIRIDKIQCNEPLQTILKTDGTPACVKPDSIEKLREYGWTNSKILSDELVREKLLELTGLLEGGHVTEFNELRTELVAFVLLERVDAVGMNLDGINLKYTSLPGANLHNATLKGANIGNADLSNANLQDSDLKGADLSYTRLWGANLHGANLQDSNLEGASLRGADLTLANLENANLENADIPITANLSAIEIDSNPHPEPYTIIIYDVTENDKTRLSIAPHTLVMNLTDGNIVRFVNDGSTSVNIFDKAKGIWRFDDVKPSSQRVLTINSTGFYEVLVQNSRNGESGRIVVLDNDVNSLFISDRIKMGKAIISDNFREYPELVSVGVGSGEIGVHVTINKKELELHEDAKSYYHEKFSKIIPFEVPIVIEFGEPIRPE